MRQGKPSEIPGAPPAGVSQPLDPRKGGGYIPLERSNTSLGEARTIMHGQPKQRRKATPWPTKTAKRAQPRRAPRPAPQIDGSARASLGGQCRSASADQRGIRSGRQRIVTGDTANDIGRQK